MKDMAGPSGDAAHDSADACEAHCTAMEDACIGYDHTDGGFCFVMPGTIARGGADGSGCPNVGSNCHGAAGFVNGLGHLCELPGVFNGGFPNHAISALPTRNAVHNYACGVNSGGAYPCAQHGDAVTRCGLKDKDESTTSTNSSTSLSSTSSNSSTTSNEVVCTSSTYVYTALEAVV